VSRRFRRSCGADAVGLGRRLPANRSILSSPDAGEDSGATAVAIVAPDAVSRVWSPALDDFIASSCRLERIRRTWFAGSGAAKVAAAQSFGLSRRAAMCGGATPVAFSPLT
jgi:hypothetical protein